MPYIPSFLEGDVGVEGLMAGVQIPAGLLLSCVTLGKLLNFSVPL